MMQAPKGGDPRPASISDGCSVVALYGTDPTPEAAQGFYESVVDWSARLGHPPDRAAVAAPGHSGNLVSFRRSDSKLRAGGFIGVQDLELVSSTPGELTGSDFYLRASWSASPSYAVTAARSSIASVSDGTLLPIARRLLRWLRPGYGIGYARAIEAGPTWYAIGIGCGSAVSRTQAEYEEDLTISRWANAMRAGVWRRGILRDIYPWNFLTAPQLAASVDGAPLEEWVQQRPGRGRLVPLCERVTLWEVGDDEQPVVREALQRSGLIFDWRVHL